MRAIYLLPKPKAWSNRQHVLGENMESTESKEQVASQEPSHAFDVFLSYSRKDREIAARLEDALERYKFLRSLKT